MCLKKILEHKRLNTTLTQLCLILLKNRANTTDNSLTINLRLKNTRKATKCLVNLEFEMVKIKYPSQTHKALFQRKENLSKCNKKKSQTYTELLQNTSVRWLDSELNVLIIISTLVSSKQIFAISNNQYSFIS